MGRNHSGLVAGAAALGITAAVGTGIEKHPRTRTREVCIPCSFIYHVVCTRYVLPVYAYIHIDLSTPLFLGQDSQLQSEVGGYLHRV